MNTTESTTAAAAIRYAIVAALVIAAFFGAYRYAGARSAASFSGGPLASVVPAGAGSGATTPGCACCGTTAPTQNGITGEPVEGSAAQDGDVQRIDVDLSQGYYRPNVIVLRSGMPAEITFGQSSGCTAQVMSDDLGFFEDLSTGPKTVRLPALEAGEYAFSCGMKMVFGKIVVR